MKILPLLVRVTVSAPRLWLPPLWLPLFLLWPLLFLLLLPLFALGVLVLLVIEAPALRSWLALFGGLYAFLCALRGTRVDVHGPDSRVLIAIS